MTDKLDIVFKTVENVLETDMPLFTDGNAGVDLRACKAMRIEPNTTALVPTSFAMVIPSGYVGQVCSRSGLAAKNSVFALNAPGIVDSSFRGQVQVILHNAGKEDFVISYNDRIAQMVFLKHETPEFIHVSTEDFDKFTTDRGENGFGSSGVK